MCPGCVIPRIRRATIRVTGATQRIGREEGERETERHYSYSSHYSSLTVYRNRDHAYSNTCPSWFVTVWPDQSSS